MIAPGQGEMRASGSYETYDDFILDIARLIKRHANSPDKYVKVEDIGHHRFFLPFKQWQSNRAQWLRIENILNGRPHYDPPANPVDL